MVEPSLLLWDVGGVVLSNAWDHPARADAVAHFQLDGVEFERRHALLVDAFEEGRLDLKGYLSETVFYTARPFTPEAFFAFMCSCSRELTPALQCARSMRESGRYVMIALNNESRELNEHRISSFGLRTVFHAFFSSCYTGLRKPGEPAYQFALRLAQREPNEVLFLDDRPENIEAATGLGIPSLWVRDPEHLREELIALGLDPPKPIG